MNAILAVLDFLFGLFGVKPENRRRGFVVVWILVATAFIAGTAWVLFA